MTADSGSPRVLVIEDNLMNMRLMEAILKGRGYELLRAFTGKEGLSQAEAHRPDLVLLDLGLPDLDGLDVVRRLREHPLLSRTPVVAVSARALKGHREEALEAGCDDYLAKPVDHHELRRKVDDLLGRRAE